MSNRTSVSTFLSNLNQKIADYKLLVKLRLSTLVVFSAVMAYLIALEQRPVDWLKVLALAMGGFLVTFASNALNQVFEKDTDKLMKRTANRPLAAGRMNISEAVLAAGLMCLVGIILLATFNPLTAFLGTLSFIFYSFIYTPLKRVSSIAVLVGAIPGALPTAIGAVAVTGNWNLVALVLFGIQFFWQFPHFWAVAWIGHEDYTNAGFRLLPNRNNTLDRTVGQQSLYYSLFLLPFCFVLYAVGITGMSSVVILTISTLIYSYFSWNLMRKCDRKAALQLMFSSFFYLPIVLFALLADKL